MPYDGDLENFIRTVEPLSDDPAVAVRQAIALLRGPLPNDWGWHFPSVEIKTPCGSIGCAMGWFRHTWPEKFSDDIGYDMESLFAMKSLEVTYFFSWDQANRRDIPPNLVTPAMIADDLEAWADSKYGKLTDART